MAAERTVAPALGRGIPRVVDIALAMVGLIVAFPVLVLAAIAVALQSRGAVLFVQQRVGRGGRAFGLVKLRTMSASSAGPLVTAGDDRRITAVGRVLRALKLDELPALWNVLRGDMSIVGPRPEVPIYVDLDDPQWRRVLAVRPGLTDPVSVRLRNEESLLAAVDGDREAFYRGALLPYKVRGYLDFLSRRTPVIDLRVMAETLLAVIAPGRYPPPSVAEVHRASVELGAGLKRRESDTRE